MEGCMDGCRRVSLLLDKEPSMPWVALPRVHQEWSRRKETGPALSCTLWMSMWTLLSWSNIYMRSVPSFPVSMQTTSFVAF
jgi:hypothetical protein